MKAKELIERLQAEPEAEVVVYDGGNLSEIASVAMPYGEAVALEVGRTVYAYPYGDDIVGAKEGSTVPPSAEKALAALAHPRSEEESDDPNTAGEYLDYADLREKKPNA